MLGKSFSFKRVQLTYHHHHGRQVISSSTKDVISKGFMAIKVGQGEEQQRITVPVDYLNHPLFIQLLKEAEEEYGFSHQGTIVIPCQVAQFKYVQHLIDSEMSHHHHHHHLVGCFRA